MDEYFDQVPRRKAEFINLPNRLKKKVGSGGLSEAVLNKAEELLKSHGEEFPPIADASLRQLDEAINIVNDKKQRRNYGDEDLINMLIPPALDLKSNGGMFHYPLITNIADVYIRFLEVIARIDDDVIEISRAFHTSIGAVVRGNIKSDGGKQGKEMVKVLNDACGRYFKKKPQNISRKN